MGLKYFVKDLYKNLVCRFIQTLRAFRLADLGGLEAWRTGGLEGWGKGKSGLENGCLGVGKLVSGRPK